MTLRNLTKIVFVGITVLGLVDVLPLRAFQAEDTTKAATKRAKKSAQDATSSDTNTTKTGSAPARTASEAEISAARAGGKVWVNTESGVYHKSGQWYGATKQGKFMTEQEARQAGYRPAKSK